MIKGLIFAYIFVIFLGADGSRASAQSSGSTLLRAKRASLIIQGEVTGKSEVSNLCGGEMPCQILILRVVNILKGDFKPKTIKVLFTLYETGQYVEKDSKSLELSRYFFENGRSWIVMFHDTKAGKCSFFSFPSEVSHQMKQGECRQSSLASIIPADPDEIETMKEFVNSIRKRKNGVSRAALRNF